MEIKAEYIIEKSNILNEFKCNDMALNELRFFCVYLSKLNAREPSIRTIRIPIGDFENFFDIKLNTTAFNKKVMQISGRSIEVRVDDTITILQLYSGFKWTDGEDCKEIEVTCNYDIVPYLFELQRNYTTYTIGNIAKLNSVSKIRLYELMKQYEKIKAIKLELEELQKIIGSGSSDFRYFKRDTLDPAIADINKHTDIFISYKKILKTRKVVAIEFTIEKQKQTQCITNDIQMIHKEEQQLPDKEQKRTTFSTGRVLEMVGIRDGGDPDPSQELYLSENDLKNCYLSINLIQDKSAMKYALQVLGNYHNLKTDKNNLSLIEKIFELLTQLATSKETKCKEGTVSANHVVSLLNTKLSEGYGLEDYVVSFVEHWKCITQNNSEIRNPVAYMKTCLYDWILTSSVQDIYYETNN